MFQKLETLAPDPILGLNQTFLQDPNPNKINLSVGVYQTQEGITPIFTAVKEAERRLIEQQETKAYIAQIGDAAYLQGIANLALGAELVNQLGQRLSVVATPGGCGALRMGGELLAQCNMRTPRIWVSNPTWSNHYPLLQDVGFELAQYDYYDFETHTVNFSRLLDSLHNIPEGEVVLLHASCHNPTGADLSDAEWDQVLELCKSRKLLPFFDSAYQGFGRSIDEDMYAVRKAVQMLPEVLISYSCSKNFGVYRERTGAIFVVSEQEEYTHAASSQILAAARRSYSMSPYAGCGIVGVLLKDKALYAQWHTQLREICQRINQLRNDLADGLSSAQSKIDFSYLTKGRGMFSFLKMSPEQIQTLRAEHGLYILDNSRVNIAGLSNKNLDEVITRIVSVI